MVSEQFPRGSTEPDNRSSQEDNKSTKENLTSRFKFLSCNICLQISRNQHILAVLFYFKQIDKQQFGWEKNENWRKATLKKKTLLESY